MLRFLTAGESHGQALVVIVEGLPGRSGRHRRGHPGRAGPPPPRLRPRPAHALRAGRGHHRGRGPPRPHARLAGGHRDRQQRVVRAEKWHRGDVAGARCHRRSPLTQPRPGHADLAGMQKYGFADARDVLERASARETAARVAAGAWPRRCCAELGVEVVSPRRPAGPARAREPAPARPGRPRRRRRVAGALLRPARPRRRWSPRSRRPPRTATRSAAWSRCWPTACPSGSAATCTGTASSTALLAQALMSIQAVKGVEIGDGFEVAGRRGSEAHDPIVWDAEAGRLPARHDARRRHRGRA